MMLAMMMMLALMALPNSVRYSHRYYTCSSHSVITLIQKFQYM